MQAGRTGVVVGGGSGIGRATCLALASRHSRLVVADREPAGAESTAREVSSTGGFASAFGCDVRELSDVERLRSHAAATLGSIDFVVLSAGITQSGGITDADPGPWRQLLETNILGVGHCLRVFMSDLERSGAGQAIVIASLSGREAYAGQPLYIASKWGALGLAHSVRKEAQSRRVRVTVIEPGLVDTPMSRVNPYARRIFETVQPLTPDDVARAVVYVLDQPANVLVRELALQPITQEI